MNLDHLLSLVRRPENVDGTHTADLEALVQEYPFFTAGHLLLLKAYKQQNSIHFKKQLRKVAAIAPDRAQVYALTEAWPEAETVLLDEMGNNLPAEADVQLPLEEVSVEMDMVSEPTFPTASVEINAPVDTQTDLTVVDPANEEAETVVEPTADDLASAAVSFTIQPDSDQVETPLPSMALSDDALLSLADAVQEADADNQNDPHAEIVLAKDEDGSLHFEFEPAEVTVSESVELQAQTEVQEADSDLMANDVHVTENMVGSSKLEEETPLDAAQQHAVEAESGQPVEPRTEDVQPAMQFDSVDSKVLMPQGDVGNYEVFVASSHDRLSWFRFFAGKPLRDQSEEVLEQLYMEHMQQDLLQAPAESPIEAMKVRVNNAEEVPSSREMEHEIKRLAYDSISDEELPASETLARIYEQQLEYKRAIKIYQKLILKFPDKMTYFAGLIEGLRQK